MNLNFKIGPPRPGDVPAIFSNYDKISKSIGWKPEFTIEDIMKTAWVWEKNRSKTNK